MITVVPAACSVTGSVYSLPVLMGLLCHNPDCQIWAAPEAGASLEGQPGDPQQPRGAVEA